MRLRHSLIPCALALACMALPSSAGAYVFWTTGEGGGAEAKLGRANLDGSAVDRSLLGGYLGGIAADASHIYFTTSSPGGEGEGGGSQVDARTNLDGGERIEKLTLGNEGGIQAVDAEHVYWLSPSGLGRAKLDFSDPEPGYLTGLDGIGLRFTVYEGFVYWPDRGARRRLQHRPREPDHQGGRTGMDPGMLGPRNRRTDRDRRRLLRRLLGLPERRWPDRPRQPPRRRRGERFHRRRQGLRRPDRDRRAGPLLGLR